MSASSRPPQMSLLRLLTRTGTGVLFLTLVITSIPLAFDVGGRQCGLAFSLGLVVFYFCLSTIRIAISTNYRLLRILVGIANLAQYLVVPALLIYCLDKFSIDEGGSDVSIRKGYKSTRGGPTWLENFGISWWDWFLSCSAPMFQLSEGFCSLLVIQTFGQISRWLVNRNRSDSWMVCTPTNDHGRLKRIPDRVPDRSPHHVRIDHFLSPLFLVEGIQVPGYWKY